MDLTFTSAVHSIQNLMGEAYFLNQKSMEEKIIQVTAGSRQYEVKIQVKYSGIDSIITAETGNTRLSFEDNQHGGIDIRMEGDELDRALINEIAWGVMKSLE